MSWMYFSHSSSLSLISILWICYAGLLGNLYYNHEFSPLINVGNFNLKKKKKKKLKKFCINLVFEFFVNVREKI